MKSEKALLSTDAVRRIARLARLSLSDDEVEVFARELSDILAYVNLLQEVDTENVRVTNQVTGLSNVMREDAVVSCENPEEIIELAPEHEGNLVKVRAVFDS